MNGSIGLSESLSRMSSPALGPRPSPVNSPGLSSLGGGGWVRSRSSGKSSGWRGGSKASGKGGKAAGKGGKRRPQSAMSAWPSPGSSKQRGSPPPWRGPPVEEEEEAWWKPSLTMETLERLTHVKEEEQEEPPRFMTKSQENVYFMTFTM